MFYDSMTRVAVVVVKLFNVYFALAREYVFRSFRFPFERALFIGVQGHPCLVL